MGLVHLYCGDGKGKTTAAIGIAVRAAGSGMEVVFCQFMKGRPTAELNILKSVENIHVFRCERDFGFYWQMSGETKAEAAKGYGEVLKKAIAEAEKYEKCLVVFDEATYAYNYNLIDKKLFESFIKNRKKGTEIVITGREPADFIINIADYISEIKKIRHPFDKGIGAREGIEF